MDGYYAQAKLLKKIEHKLIRLRKDENLNTLIFYRIFKKAYLKTHILFKKDYWTERLVILKYVKVFLRDKSRACSV